MADDTTEAHLLAISLRQYEPALLAMTKPKEIITLAIRADLQLAPCDSRSLEDDLELRSIAVPLLRLWTLLEGRFTSLFRIRLGPQWRPPAQGAVPLLS